MGWLMWVWGPLGHWGIEHPYLLMQSSRGGILNIVVSFVLSFVVSHRDNTALILL